MDLRLPPESAVSGTLRADLEGEDEGAGTAVDLAEATMSLVSADGTVNLSAEVDAEGAFAFPALHAGAYTLALEGAAAGLVRDAWRGPDGAPRLISVPAGAPVELGEVLAPLGARIGGVVTEAGAGTAVPGVMVLARPSQAGELRYAQTDVAGRYAIDGLPPGVYQLSIQAEPECPADDGWVALYPPEEANEAHAMPVVLRPGDAYGWDPRLPPDDDHDRMDDAWETEHRLDPRADDAGLDPDRDGFDNLDEYLFGTDPHDPGAEECGCGYVGASGAAGWLCAAVVARRRRR
jgi:hypothetical protein